MDEEFAAGEDAQLREAHGTDTGELLELDKELAAQGVTPCGVGGSLAKVDPHEQETIGGKPEVRVLQVVGSPRQQTSADEQRQRQCQLQAHDESARTELAERADAAATLFLETGSGITAAGYLPGWQQPNNSAAPSGRRDERSQRRAGRAEKAMWKRGSRFRDHSNQRAVERVRDRDRGEPAPDCRSVRLSVTS